jgi:hypothetical protein
VSSINLTPEPGDELVPLRNGFGSSELNIGTSRYVPDALGIFWVPRHSVDRTLLTIAGFHVEAPTKAESLRAVATAICQMQPCAEKDALRAALAGLFPEA